MRTERQMQEDMTWTGMLIIVCWAISIMLFSSGCAGEIYLGTRRIDEVQQTQVMKDKPLKCLFVECGGMEK